MSTDRGAPLKSKTKPLNTVFGRAMAACLLASTVLLLATGAYLSFISLFELLAQRNLEKFNFQYVFAGHLLLSIPFLVCAVFYLFSHLRAIESIKNLSARKVGAGLSVCLGFVVVSGLVLTRGVSEFEVNDPIVRGIVYAVHLLLPIYGVYLYISHRNRGRSAIPVKSTVVNIAMLLGLVFIASSLELQPLSTVEGANADEKMTFSPSLLKVKGGDLIEPSLLMRDEYCQECHTDIHEQWSASAHKMSSFNNPYYNFSITNTRAHMLERDNSVIASRFCAGCHDPIPLVSGYFDDPGFDVASHPSARAGLTCTVCHSITSIDSPKGNADFTLAAPTHYPFAFSESKELQWFSNLLVKSNPDFHKETFLKPLHKTTEFCGSCHKVHIPEEINDYRWLRGQNHYDSFLQSGVSGHNVDSFYYPKTAQTGCNECHMELIQSNDNGAKLRDVFSGTSVKDHLFASGNTALAATLLERPDDVIDRHKALLEGSLRVDIVGVRESGQIDGELQMIENQEQVKLEPGKTYLVEVVLRTLTLGHAFTNGTSDSNQIWVEFEAWNGGESFAVSGKLDEQGIVPESGTHFVQNFLVDKDGQRITERNVEDIYTTVKNHQLPPGASDVVHYQITIPEDVKGELALRAALHYRKFNAEYTRKSLEKSGAEWVKLPVVTIAADALSIKNGKVAFENEDVKPDRLSRLNDYGIGLFRKPGKKQYRQAEEVFKMVEDNGGAQGVLNLVRLYFNEGQLQKAAEKLKKLNEMDFVNRWSAEWYSAQISLNSGFVDEGIASLERLYDITQWPEAERRGFDFSYDYKLLAKLADALFVMGSFYAQPENEHPSLIEKSQQVYERLLLLEPENAIAHFGLAKIAKRKGDSELFSHHERLYRRYKKDEHAESKAVTKARSLDPYIDQIANSVVIYPLN